MSIGDAVGGCGGQIVLAGDEEKVVVVVGAEVEPSHAAVVLRDHPVGVTEEGLVGAAAGDFAEEAEGLVKDVGLVFENRVLGAVGGGVGLAVVAGVRIGDGARELREPVDVARGAVGVEMGGVELDIERFGGSGRRRRDVVPFFFGAGAEEESG